MTITVRYRPKNAAAPALLEIAEPARDGFEVLLEVEKRMGVVPAQVDLKFMQIMAARNTPSGEESGGREVGQARTTGGPDAAPRSVGVRDTSLAAYRKARPTLNRQQTQLVEWLRAHPGAHTRQEIAKATGWAINRICPRVKELVDLEVLAECSPRKCGATGESARPLVLADAMEKAA